VGKQRQTWTAQQKQAIVLAALRGDHSIAELARQHSIREPLLYRWKSVFLEAGTQALGGRLCQMLCTPGLGSILFNSNAILELGPRDDRPHLLRTV